MRCRWALGLWALQSVQGLRQQRSSGVVPANITGCTGTSGARPPGAGVVPRTVPGALRGGRRAAPRRALIHVSAAPASPARGLPRCRALPSPSLPRRKLDRKMTDAFAALWGVHREMAVPLRTAAFVVALQRVTRAEVHRGFD